MSSKWYILHSMSGSEKRVKESILEQAAKKKMLDYFEDIVIPTIEVPEVKRGKKVFVEKKFMPGYILVKMNMTDEAWHVVKSIPKVSGFLGNISKPQPVSDVEINNIFKQMDKQTQNAAIAESYEVGEVVKVVDGPFDSFSGVVEEVDYDKSRMRVAVSIFGRSTPIDLNFKQVEKS